MPPDLAVVCAALMVFTYAGYPALALLLSILARRHPPSPAAPAPAALRATVLLPVHDEGDRVLAKVYNLLDQRCPSRLLRIIVIDDGSTDGSVDALAREDLDGVEILRLPERRGKAAALNAGLEVATGDIVIFTDARQRLASRAIAALLGRFADPAVAAVTGRLETSRGTGGGLFRRYVEALRSWESCWGSCAGATGALYAVRRERAMPLLPVTILDDLVMSLSAAAAGRLVYEPRAVAVEEREDAVRAWRRRLRTLAGNWQVFLHPLRYRRVFSARSIAPLVCQKLLRLLFPFFALGLAASLAAGPAGSAGRGALAAVVAVTAAMLAAAFLDAWVRLLPSRLARAAWAFACAFAAPIHALARYLSGRESVLWARASR